MFHDTRTWVFSSTGEAYDACQTNDEIETGDLLLCVGDQVVGLADTWPVAITAKAGHLHSPKEGVRVRDLLDEFGRDTTAPLFDANRICDGLALARSLSWPVREEEAEEAKMAWPWNGPMKEGEPT